MVQECCCPGILDGPIDADQAWFWTPAWQAGEREAHERVVSGDGTVYGSTDDFVAHLDGSAGDDAT